MRHSIIKSGPAGIVALLLTAGTIIGCSQTEHRLSADREAYCTIAERNGDPRWSQPDVRIDIDPRSRYFDPYNPDCSPMPSDDPSSHRYMQCVDGKKGWKHWYDNGFRGGLENPVWRARLSECVDLNDTGAIRLDVDSALRLAYIHAPLHQTQLETLYLSSLDVTGERFRLDTQFFGGHNVNHGHTGDLTAATISFVPGMGYQVTAPTTSVDSNRLNLTTDIEARRRFATAGEVLVGFANSFVFEFSGGDVSLASSLANFTFMQPLLRGAGRDIALEQLTQSERRLLANLRAYSQWRQGLFTQVVIGELGVNGPSREPTSTTLLSFSGTGGVNGYLGLLQQAQQIRNTEDNLRLQLRTRDRLEALYDNDLIDIVQLDQFRQNIEVTRANRLDQTNALKLAVDNYTTGTLGLPSDLPIEVDEALIEQFQLIPSESTPVLESLLELQARIGDVGELLDIAAKVEQREAELQELPGEGLDVAARVLDKLLGIVESTGRRVEDLADEVRVMQQREPGYPDRLKQEDATALRMIIERVKAATMAGDDEQLTKSFKDAAANLELLLDELNAENLAVTLEQNSEWFDELLMLCRGVVLVQWISRDASIEPEAVLERAFELVEPVEQLFAGARDDLQRMEDAAQQREERMSEDEIKNFRRDRERLHQRLRDLELGDESKKKKADIVSFKSTVEQLKQIRENADNVPTFRTIRGLTGWIQSYLQVAERLALVPAQARLEIIGVEAIDLEPDDAFQIALNNRLDFMNGRAALVDRWRAIAVAADALQSNLTITGGGTVGTGKNNPVDFRASTSSLRLGLEFDAPLARLLERNGYRESLITYQRNRRSLIQSHDNLQKGLRALLRTLEQRRLQLEIQRRAVSIALRRVDQTQLSLLTPPPQGQPGVRPQINPTTAINLLGAQSSLQTSQNSFLSAWLNYYAARVRLFRELGVMQLDPSGKWIENSMEFSSPVVELDAEMKDGIPALPPALPVE